MIDIILSKALVTNQGLPAPTKLRNILFRMLFTKYHRFKEVFFNFKMLIRIEFEG